MSVASGGRVPGTVHAPYTLDLVTVPDLEDTGEVTVGVIDTGIVLGDDGRPAPWFGDHVSYCREDDQDRLYGESGTLLPSAGHGTAIAGIVLREAPTARVRMWGVLDKERQGPAASQVENWEDEAVVAALASLTVDMDVRVVNLSFGGTVWEVEPPRTLERALEAFIRARPDVSIVAAAGNTDGEERTTYPASFPGVLAVGAVDESAPGAPVSKPTVASFSNHGSHVDVYARGVDVRAPMAKRNTLTWALWEGTSCASAVVAGCIARLAAADKSLTGREAERKLLTEAPRHVDGVPWVASIDTSYADPSLEGLLGL
ncbi:subtilisin family serine protease [Nocardioides sp. BE266]|uniref:S8/S53 family peptidase n=1 Tax=Nocardioides sp. BE266 TaxID=2817725 RepID=UPI00285A739B|nr:S8/S53 family peptidase [Nocardioides sp. BE266]MDR7252601.1 subtilisin family serine protease [Nocardioides sp. BE266]